MLAKDIIPKGRCVYLEQNVNLVETPAVESKPQKFKICRTADFAKMAKIKKKYKFLKNFSEIWNPKLVETSCKAASILPIWNKENVRDKQDDDKSCFTLRLTLKRKRELTKQTINLRGNWYTKSSESLPFDILRKRWPWKARFLRVVPCLRFYVRWIFIERLTNSNLFICPKNQLF